MFSGKTPPPFNVYRSIGVRTTEQYGIGVFCFGFFLCDIANLGWGAFLSCYLGSEKTAMAVDAASPASESGWVCPS